MINIKNLLATCELTCINVVKLPIVLWLILSFAISCKVDTSAQASLRMVQSRNTIFKKAGNGVDISASPTGQLPENKIIPFTANVNPPVNCTKLRIKVYGIEGVHVFGKQEKEYVTCTKIARIVQLSISPSTSGFAVVQVFYLDPEGQARSVVKSFSLQSETFSATSTGKSSTNGIRFPDYSILPAR